MNRLNNSKYYVISNFSYRRLLILYPAAFRERFGTELIQTYEDLVTQDKSDRTFLSLLELWYWLLTDLFTSVVFERYQEWRNNMKSRWLIAKGFGFCFLALWFLFWGLSFGRNMFHLPIKDPTYWLLGDQFSNLALNSLNFSILFGPLIVLAIFLIPSLQINHVSVGNDILQIRVLRMSKLSLLIITICGVITVLFWSVILLSRLGLL